MDRLDAMALFVAAVDEGSLAAAARKFGRSPASATRAVTLLEDLHGERLLHRTTRQLKLTETGQQRLSTYRNILAEYAVLEDRPDAGAPLAGVVRLTTSEMFGRLKLMPVVEGFLAAQPGVRTQVLLANRVVDLVEEGVDAAVRLAPLPDSNLVSIRLGEVRRLICAAPDYIARKGVPQTPADLAQHDCIGETDANEHVLWRFAAPGPGRERTSSTQVHPRIALNGVGAAQDAALRGQGICLAFSYQVAEHVAAGRLVMLLADYEPQPTPVHFVFHPIPRRSGLLRAFIDYATPRLREDLTGVGEMIA